MSSDELRRLASKSDKGYSEAKGTLTMLHRKILYDLGISLGQIKDDLEKWISNPSSGVPQTPRARTQARGNYIKKIIADSMSWRSFTDLVSMLRPLQARIKIELYWGERQGWTVHELPLDLQKRNELLARTSGRETDPEDLSESDDDPVYTDEPSNPPTTQGPS